MSLGKKLILATAFTMFAVMSVQAQGNRTGQVRITSPVSGADVSGTVAVTVQTAGDVAWVNFYLDGNYEASSPPDTWDWNTSGLVGSHTVSVTAFSANHKLLGSDQVSVTIAQATPTPDPTATATSSPTPAPSATPSSTPTPAPTSTPTPAPTTSPTPAPSPTATPSGTAPMKANDFLNTLGAGTHLSQGGDSVSQIESALSYSGIRKERDDESTNSSVLSGFCSIHAALGTMIDMVTGHSVNMGPFDTLVACGALDQVEGPNEPNNFSFSYNGENCGGTSSTWLGCADFQRDFYNAVKGDSNLASVKVLDLTEPGAETDNQGLQFLTIPSGYSTVQPAGTVYADVANLHNYVEGNGQCGYLNDNQAWGVEDPANQPGSGCWDDMTGEYLYQTWNKHFAALSLSSGPAQPKETTETGWQTGTNYPREISQDQQGKLLTDLYLSGAKRGWLRTYVYQLMDDGQGTWGMFVQNGSSATPKLSGTYVHNMTTVLNDSSSNFTPTPLAYSVNGETSTIHDLLLQKSDGMYELVVWGDQLASEKSTPVTVQLPNTYAIINVYDVTSGTNPVNTLSNANAVPLTITDHAVIIEFGG